MMNREGLVELIKTLFDNNAEGCSTWLGNVVYTISEEHLDDFANELADALKEELKPIATTIFSRVDFCHDWKDRLVQLGEYADIPLKDEEIEAIKKFHKFVFDEGYYDVELSNDQKDVYVKCFREVMRILGGETNVKQTKPTESKHKSKKDVI